MKKPRFSVIIPTLNEEKFVLNLLDSLARQTVKDFEVIVVDGASKDKTLTVVKRFAGKLPLLEIISLPKPGVSAQRNIGAHKAKADWLVFIDADSVLLSNFFERVSVYINRNHPKFLTTWFRADKDDAVNAITALFLNTTMEGGVLIDRPWAPGPLTVVQKKVFEMVGGYDESASFGEDHDFSMAIHQKGIPLTIIREILYIYSLRRYRHEGSLKAFEKYSASAIQVTLTKRSPKHMLGFEAGGQIYDRKRPKKPFISKDFENLLKKFFREFVE